MQNKDRESFIVIDYWSIWIAYKYKLPRSTDEWFLPAVVAGPHLEDMAK
jgi:hypothetical protein